MADLPGTNIKDLIIHAERHKIITREQYRVLMVGLIRAELGGVIEYGGYEAFRALLDSVGDKQD